MYNTANLVLFFVNSGALHTILNIKLCCSVIITVLVLVCIKRQVASILMSFWYNGIRAALENPKLNEAPEWLLE